MEVVAASERKRQRLIKTLIVSALVWEFIQVLMFITFTPPMKPVLDLLGVTSSLSETSSVMFLFHQSIFYHSLMAPFIAVLAYVTLLIFDVRGLSAKYAIYSVTGGYVLASGGGMSQFVTGWNPISHGIFLTGLALCFTAGIALLVAFNPFKKAIRERQSWRWRLIRMNMWLAILFALTTALVGAYASMGSSQWGASGTVEKFDFFRTTHEHAIVTVIDAALVVLVAEHFGIFRFKGLRKTFSDLGMYSILIGIPSVAIATYASIPFGVAAHTIITPFASVLLQGALFVMFAIMANMALRPGGGSILTKIFGDPLAFGLLFTFLWVDVAVSLPGIYVAVNLSAFAGLPNELPFIRGHEHALVTITAIALLLLVASIFDFKGAARKLIGVTVTAGYVIGLGAVVPYIFLNPDPYTGSAIRYIQLGIILMLAGVLATIVTAIIYLRKAG